MIDWNGKLEVVVDGNEKTYPCSVSSKSDTPGGDYRVTWHDSSGVRGHWFYADGRSNAVNTICIRNVAPETPQGPAGGRSEGNDELSVLETFLWRLIDAISEAATSLAETRKR